MANKPAIIQPPFDSRIKTLAYPLEGKNNGSLTRGYMVWEKTIPGFSNNARVHFLYNPSSVQASFSMGTAGATIQFPNAGDQSDLRIQLNQTASWSILFDRTYELWGQYHEDGTPKQGNGPDNNNQSVYGVLADLYQMQQFTGMTVGYTPGGQVSHTLSSTSLSGRQGIFQLIPSYVYFGGGKNSLAFYGYVSDWDYTITHWTQFMVPMRVIVDITWTMLPPPSNLTTITGSPGLGVGARKAHELGLQNASQIISVSPVSSSAGISGR